MSVFAVSDLHGRYDLWQQIKEYLKPEDILYFLGDAADRGPQGWQIIKEALTMPNVRYILGNHDDMLIYSWRTGYMSYIWMCNGGESTWDAMVEDDLDTTDRYVEELSYKPIYVKHINENEQIIHLSHAGFTLMQNDELPSSEDLFWDRDHLGDTCSWWEKENPNDFCVFGHSPVCWIEENKVDITLSESGATGTLCGGHKIDIDAGAVWTDQIALFNLDTLKEEVVFKV